MVKSVERYPVWIIVCSNLLTLSIYALGFIIFLKWHILLALLYLLYCAVMELNLLKRGCVDCYYYGKPCGFGRGLVCALFFPKGDPKKFAARNVTWSAMLPDFLVSIFPLIGGTVLLIRHFSWTIAAAVAAILILSSMGNALVRGKLVCRICRQRDIGCPAEQLFNKKRGKK